MHFVPGENPNTKSSESTSMPLNERQWNVVNKWAGHVRSSSPEAIGLAILPFDCGCLQAGPFDANGDQAGPVVHLGQLIDSETKLCEECMKDGGSPARVDKPFLLFFQPCRLGMEERERIGAKIFCESPTSRKEV
jgi:hypothetical protein